jgi:hypothetical protein
MPLSSTDNAKCYLCGQANIVPQVRGCAPPAPGAALLGDSTLVAWYPFTHLAREGAL